MRSWMLTRLPEFITDDAVYNEPFANVDTIAITDRNWN